MVSPTTSPLLPYTTLFRSILLAVLFAVTPGEWLALIFAIGLVVQAEIWNTIMEKISDFIQPQLDPRIKVIKDLDRKSTRLNSSHVKISYAVFCLKKKKQQC